ncbi:HEAT repeat-containing protein [Sinosporangium album]|uniref:HEAT repeat-containing protein n=1 Tax=Sinosporangium album TaxID=504805 RepID=A0A1G7U3P2_9ACTN|nr:HEAT repeat domain-containing protein [Sinosporangium album]SDG42073.1 HEAT repeat-containing protein [Sinosporangium album]
MSATTEISDLVQAALTDRDPDGPIRWQAIADLQRRGDLATFTEARRLCAGQTTTERVLGVDILGQLGTPDRPFADRSLPILRFLATCEEDPIVLYSVLIALGHLRDRRALPTVIDLARHEDPRVRYGAAYALPNVVGTPPDPTGLAALRVLVEDGDDDVADWAALGLALTSADL